MATKLFDSTIVSTAEQALDAVPSRKAVNKDEPGYLSGYEHKTIRIHVS